MVTVQVTFSTEKELCIVLPYNNKFLPKRMTKGEENHKETQIQMQCQFNDKKASSIQHNIKEYV